MFYEKNLCLWSLYIFLGTFNDGGSSVTIFLSKDLELVWMSLAATSVSVSVEMDSWCPDSKACPVMVLLV